jgi:hypothetical protein
MEALRVSEVPLIRIVGGIKNGYPRLTALPVRAAS